MRVLERENPTAAERKDRGGTIKEVALFYFFLFWGGCLVGWIGIVNKCAVEKYPKSEQIIFLDFLSLRQP